MKTQIPQDADTATRDFGKRLLDELGIEFGKRAPDMNARNNLLLAAPDGSIWAVTVDNTGTLATTKVYG